MDSLYILRAAEVCDRKSTIKHRFDVEDIVQLAKVTDVSLQRVETKYSLPRKKYSQDRDCRADGCAHGRIRRDRDRVRSLCPADGRAGSGRSRPGPEKEVARSKEVTPGNMSLRSPGPASGLLSVSDKPRPPYVTTQHTYSSSM